MLITLEASGTHLERSTLLVTDRVHWKARLSSSTHLLN